jgi:hypothetical protein
MEEEKITIIEGPPPAFDVVYDDWAVGLAESPYLGDVAVTRVRTFNGPSLVERCHRAWRNKQPINLEFRTQEGLPREVPILASRAVNTQDGEVLLLWVRLSSDDALYQADDDEIDNRDIPF